MRTLVMPALLAGSLSANVACAQAVDGTLDTGWADGGQRVVSFDLGANHFDFARAIVVDSHARAVVAGTVTTANSTRIGLVRLLPDGSLDTTFGVDHTGLSVVPSGGLAIEGNAAVAEGDGHVVLAGSRIVSGNDSAMVVCHMDANGSLGAFEDSQFACSQLDFNLGGTSRDVANAILMQPDGKYVVAGSAATVAGNALAVARFNHDGSLDTTFGTVGKTTFVPASYKSFVGRRIIRLPDGSFGIAGAAIQNDDIEFGFLVHLDADGVLDEGFHGQGFARSPSSNTAFSDLGWDVAGGFYVVVGTYDGVSGDDGVAECYLPTGNSVVCPGGNPGDPDIELGYDTQFNALLRESDGRWLVAGTRRATQAAATDAFVARLDRALHVESVEFAAPAGFIAHDFGLPGLADGALAIAQSGPRVLIAGFSLAVPNTVNLDYSVFAVGMDRIFQNGFQK